MSALLVDGICRLEDPEIVLFDKDGTLIDIHHYWASMIRIRASIIANKFFLVHDDKDNIQSCLVDAMGVDLKTDRIKADGPVGIKPRTYITNMISEMVRSRNISITDDEIESIFSEVDRSTSECILPLLKPLPGAFRFLESLKRCGIAAVVVSTDITDRARKAMEALEIDHLFAEILGGDSVKHTKPSPDLALKAIRECNCNASKAVVIGDHPVDIKMGELADTGLNIGVLTGLSESISFEGMRCIVVPDLTSVEVRG